MVKVPNSNLQAMAAQAAQASIDIAAKKQGSEMLTETWNEQSAKKHLEREGIISPTRDLAISPSPLQLSDH